MLLTEKNTQKVERLVLRCAKEAAANREIQARPNQLCAFFEHGQWWIEDRMTGAQWSVCDAEPGPFVFEQVTIGEGE